MGIDRVLFISIYWVYIVMENISSTNEAPQPLPSTDAKAMADKSAGKAKSHKKSIVLVAAIILVLVVLIVFLSSKKPQISKLEMPVSIQQIPTPPIKSGDFVSVVRWEKTLPESLRTKRPQAKMTIDGVSYIREYAVVKKIVKEGVSYLLLLSSSNQEITTSLDKKTLIAKAFYGYDSNGALTNIQYYGLNKNSLTEVKIGDLIYIAHPESNQTQLTEFVFVE